MNPKLKQFLDRFQRDVLPNLRTSHIVVSICPSGPDGPDAKFMLELGAAVMLDKPLLAVVRPGTKIPEKLARVVDRFVELDENDPNLHARLSEAVQAMLVD